MFHFQSNQNAPLCHPHRASSVSHLLEPQTAPTLITIIAVAASVQKTSHSHVSLTLPRALDSGARHFALHKAVAARVSSFTHLGSIFILTGEVTSPNYPGTYPHNFELMQTIQVKQGLILSLQFTAFNIAFESFCSSDYLTVTDGDGTTLLEKRCGYSSNIEANNGYYYMPPRITSNTNVVNLIFKSDPFGSMGYGWSVSWSAITAGEYKLIYKHGIPRIENAVPVTLFVFVIVFVFLSPFVLLNPHHFDEMCQRSQVIVIVIVFSLDSPPHSSL